MDEHFRAAPFEGKARRNTLLADLLTPKNLGKLVGVYEHSVFTQLVISTLIRRHCKLEE